ncbi:MAG: 3-dehydroquinate synthase [Bacteroidetes bacterium]|nr:3-dehydroquinate synthase [Bacteroidota bacterium]
MPSLKKNQNSIFIDESNKSSINAFLKTKNYTSYFIICDSNTLKYCLSKLILSCKELKNAEVIELEPGEESKDIHVISHVWQTLTEFGANKKSLIINLGGGVVSDAGGFVASTFKRGIDFINVPTTLLSMVDASVGGKTGINFAGIKNLIGTITQPKGVFIDTRFLETLPARHIVNGSAEIIKAALIRDRKFFDNINSARIKNFAEEDVISKSISIKSKVVKIDPDEKGFRKILNFGHTIGHAVESLFFEKPEPLLHGEAIAIGMAVESYISCLLKRISKNEFEKIIQCIGRHFQFLPINEADMTFFFTYFGHDKKHTSTSFNFALLNGIGKCDYDIKVSKAMVQKALLYYNNNICNAA